MDEIKIEPETPEELPSESEEGLEKSKTSQREIKVEKVAEEKEIQKTIPKKFIYLVAAIIIIFIVGVAFIPVKNYFFPPTGQAITVGDLLIKNMEGELPEDQGYVYNGFSFVLVDGLWYSEVQYENKIFQIPLHFGPRDLEDIPIQGKLNDNFEQDEVYLTFDPLTSDDFVGTALGELAQNLAMIIYRQPIGACDQNETEACHNRPIVNCEDKDKAVIYLVQEPGPKIELKGNCLVLKGQGYDIIRAADRILYQWYGVMS